MTGILLKIFRAWVNALSFVGNEYEFCKSGHGDAGVKRKRLYLAKVYIRHADETFLSTTKYLDNK